MKIPKYTILTKSAGIVQTGKYIDYNKDIAYAVLKNLNRVTYMVILHEKNNAAKIKVVAFVHKDELFKLTFVHAN